MRHTLLMVPIGLGVGLTTVSIGLVHALERQGINTTYLTPFDNIQEIERFLSAGQENAILEAVIGQVEEQGLKDGILLVQGIISTQLRPYAPALNHVIAKALDAEVIFVATPSGKSPNELKEQVTIASKPYGGVESQRTIGCMINKVGAPVDQYGNARFDLFDPPEDPEIGGAFCKLFDHPNFRVLGCFPWKRQLMAPRVEDVAQYLEAQVINEGNFKSSRVNSFAIAGATVENMVKVLQPETMIFTPADRTDIIMATSLCHRAMEEGLPILKVKTDSLRTAISLQNLNVKIPEDDLERRTALKEYFASFIDGAWIKSLLSTQEERSLSPPAFRYRLLEKARKARKRIVLPEGEEPRIIEAAATCAKRGIARPILLGNADKIHEIAKNNGIDLSPEVETFDPEPLREKYLPLLIKLRAHKGVNEAFAREALLENIVVGTLMLHEGEVDGLVAGAIHTTAQTIRPALTLIKTKPNVTKVSSIFFMCLPKQVLVYGDCAVNQNPTAEELADIAIQCADSAQQFGIPPRVAMISYSTGTSGTGAEVAKVQEATNLVKEKRPDLLIDGPLQYDAAYSLDVAAKKAPNSPVAGKATIYVFPDLNTANTTYKAVQRSADVLSIGPMLQGLKKPVNDLSRGALVDDIVYTIAITAIQST